MISGIAILSPIPLGAAYNAVGVAATGKMRRRGSSRANTILVAVSGTP